MRKRQRATTCAHHDAVQLQVQLHEVIRLRSNTTATLNVPLACATDCGGITVALRWNPEEAKKKTVQLTSVHTKSLNYAYMSK